MWTYLLHMPHHELSDSIHVVDAWERNIGNGYFEELEYRSCEKVSERSKLGHEAVPHLAQRFPSFLNTINEEAVGGNAAVMQSQR